MLPSRAPVINRLGEEEQVASSGTSLNTTVNCVFGNVALPKRQQRHRVRNKTKCQSTHTLLSHLLSTFARTPCRSPGFKSVLKTTAVMRSCCVCNSNANALLRQGSEKGTWRWFRVTESRSLGEHSQRH